MAALVLTRPCAVGYPHLAESWTQERHPRMGPPALLPLPVGVFPHQCSVPECSPNPHP